MGDTSMLEEKALCLSGDLASTMRTIIAAGGNPETVDSDMAELVGHIHDIQRMVFQNIAARWDPETVRPLGGTLRD